MSQPNDPIAAFVLSTIFQYLPEKVKTKIIMDTLSRNGFQVKLKDLQPPRQRMMKIKAGSAVPYAPPYRCMWCNAKLLDGYDTPEEERAKAFKEHLPSCTIFKIQLDFIREHLVE